METEILLERKKELKILQIKKEDILQKITALEGQLDETNREINTRISRYREVITSRISRLENEVNGKKGEIEPPTLD